MNLRFLAAAGPTDALRELEGRIGSARENGLAKAFEAGSLAVWTFPTTPTLIAADGRAMLVGLLFDGETGARLSAPSGAEVGQPLSGRRWGPHILFATAPCEHSVLRDPSGALPVYHGTLGELEIYASDAGLLEAAWSTAFRPDLDFIRHWLTFPFLRTARTGVEGVRELLPGAYRRASPVGEDLGEAWSPFTFTGSDRAITSFNEAAALLREEILRTIPALAAAGGEVALQLSGGLDSSIIAAALAHAGIGFRAVTFATLSADGDERRFAREMAERCDVKLVELVEETRRPMLDVRAANPLRPPPNPLLQPLHRAISLQLTLLGADTVLDGAGGDNIFASLNTASPAVDAFRRAGSSVALRALREIAQVHRCTYWTAVRSALRRVRRGAPSRWPRDTTFLAEGAAAPAREAHPWLVSHPGLLPGSADHVRMIAGIHHFLSDPGPMTPTSLHPLLAQPLLELCLRIPSWLWVAGGRDRSVAREAVRGLVPDAILDRRGKGTLESMFMKNYMSARPSLEELLVEGRLAGHGIIDATAVSAYLRHDREPRDLGYVRLLEIAAAEQWLRSFSG